MKNAILKTLIYADIFDWPLTKDEIWQRLVGDADRHPLRKIRKNKFQQVLAILLKSKKINSKNNYYFLPGNKKLIKKRERREKISKKKLQFAKKIIKKLSLIPTIKFIGITGSVASDNAKRGDDIDLFIITRQKRLWLTRFFITIILEILRVRRRPRDKDVSDKICPNLYVDEARLDIFSEQKNLFLAYEIMQLKPILNRNRTYEKFILANSWVKDFLLNFKPNFKSNFVYIDKRSFVYIDKFGDILEDLAYKLQLLWMKKKRTNEKVLPYFAAFHPRDMSKKVWRKFTQSLNN